MRKRVDDNQKQLVTALRKIGCTVLHLHEVGKGCPDILVGTQGKNILMEIKDGTKPPSARRLTKDEQSFFENWKGLTFVVHDIDEAIEVINTCTQNTNISEVKK